MQRFNEKLVVISGGASGMGALTAKRIVEEGGTAITLNRDGHESVTIGQGNADRFFIRNIKSIMKTFVP